MSIRDRNGLTNPRDRLPDVGLPSLSGQGTTQVRPRGRTSRVLLLLHRAECPECSAYVHRLAARKTELEAWDARLLVVLPTGTEAHALAATQELPFPVVVDAEGSLASTLTVSAPAIVIADQWGEIDEAEEAGTDHRFPEPDDVIGWARYLAIQCPECQGEAL